MIPQSCLTFDKILFIILQQLFLWELSLLLLRTSLLLLSSIQMYLSLSFFLLHLSLPLSFYFITPLLLPTSSLLFLYFSYSSLSPFLFNPPSSLTPCSPSPLSTLFSPSLSHGLLLQHLPLVFLHLFVLLLSIYLYLRKERTLNDPKSFYFSSFYSVLGVCLSCIIPSRCCLHCVSCNYPHQPRPDEEAGLGGGGVPFQDQHYYLFIVPL